MTTDDARARAMKSCKESAQKNEACTVVSVDNTEVHP
jgi:hypothetical protein